MTYFTKQTPSVKIWNSFPVLFCLDICPPPPRVLKADERRASRERSKTLSILMFLKWAGCKIVKNSKCIWGVLQMLNLAGAWHLLLSSLPLSHPRSQTLQLKRPQPSPASAACQKDIKLKRPCKSQKTKISLFLFLVCLYKLRHWLSVPNVSIQRYKLL